MAHLAEQDKSVCRSGAPTSLCPIVDDNSESLVQTLCMAVQRLEQTWSWLISEACDMFIAADSLAHMCMQVMSRARCECSVAQETCIGDVQGLALLSNFAGNVQEMT